MGFLRHVVLDGTETGLPFVVAFLGVWLTFRLQRDFDLTVQGSFPLGAAVLAASATSGRSAWVGMLLAALAGAVAGSLTYLIMRLLRQTLLLASIIVGVGLYSVNLYVMGQPSVALYDTSNVVDQWGALLPGQSRTWTSIEIFGLITAGVCGAVGLLLRSELGLALRASGINASMVRAGGTSPSLLLYLCVTLGNACAALGGSLVAQQQQFVDVGMGTGTIIYGITAILLGETLVHARGSGGRGVLAVVVGALGYRIVLAGAFRAGFPPMYFQATTSLIVLTLLFGRVLRGRITAQLHRRGPRGGMRLRQRSTESGLRSQVDEAPTMADR